MQTSPRYRDRSLKIEKSIRCAFEFKNDEAPYIIDDANYWLFGELQENIPIDYCDANPQSLILYQQQKIEKHTQTYNDAYIPFLMPWYGTGVLASGFGVDIKFLDYMDPAVGISTMKDICQLNDLKKPDPKKDGLMPRVLNTIRYMRENTDLPVGITDCQGPLTTALQIVGYDTMIYWMHDYPEKIHEFMQLITDALIEWVKIQKQAADQSMDDDAYVLGVKIPHGFGGVWIADDDSVIFGKDLYREFAVPYNSQVLKAFGGGAIHYCGNANQHIQNFLATEGLNAINNLNLDDLDGAAKMRYALAEKKIAYMTADFNLEDNRTDEYYRDLFAKMGTKGLIVVSYIAPAIALNKGKYLQAHLDAAETGQKIEKAIQKYNRGRK